MFQVYICVTCCNATCIKHVCVCKHISTYVSDPPSQISLTLNGNQGNEVVLDTQRVTFDCAAGDGRPTPTVRLVSRANGTEVHSELSPLTYSVMARCEDSGVYVCTARNGMGTQEVSVTASLTVQCECAEIVSVWLYLYLPFFLSLGGGCVVWLSAWTDERGCQCVRSL